MRWLAFVGLVGLLSGCGQELAEEESAQTQAQGAPESWCNSYTTQQFCPKNICVWDPTRTPSCTLPAASRQAQ